MDFRSELCHIEQTRAIVRVTAWNGDVNLGNTFGEAETAELAEDRAIKRLLKRMNSKQNDILNNSSNLLPEVNDIPTDNSNNTNKDHLNDTNKDHLNDTNKYNKLKLQGNEGENTHNEEDMTLNVPNDWTEILTAIDLEMKRLGWGKTEEAVYLEKLFNCKNRNRITDYNSITLLLDMLKRLRSGDTPDILVEKEERNLLINKGDQFIKKLGWNNDQARNFLENELKCRSRNSMQTVQLRDFNRLLLKQLKTNLQEKT